MQQTLGALEQVARTGASNLLEAARTHATVDEISDVLRKVFGDHNARPRFVRGIYGKAYRNEPEYQVLQNCIHEFSTRLGAKPKIMIAKLGQDGHDRGAQVIASAFADMGFDMLAGPLFQTPQEAARIAIEAKVQMVGVSSLAAGHKTLLPQLTGKLKAHNSNIITICGGVVPRQDYDFLRAHGVTAVFGPGTNVIEAAAAVLDIMQGQLRNT